MPCRSNFTYFASKLSSHFYHLGAKGGRFCKNKLRSRQIQNFTNYNFQRTQLRITGGSLHSKAGRRFLGTDLENQRQVILERLILEPSQWLGRVLYLVVMTMFSTDYLNVCLGCKRCSTHQRYW